MIVTSTASFQLLPEGILLVKFLPNDIVIDEEEAKRHLEAANTIMFNKQALVLVDATESMHELTSEAKDFIANHPIKIAEAILVKELHQRIIATFYLKLSRSLGNHPTKVFSDINDAKKWLLSFAK